MGNQAFFPRDQVEGAGLEGVRPAHVGPVRDEDNPQYILPANQNYTDPAINAARSAAMNPINLSMKRLDLPCEVDGHGFSLTLNAAGQIMFNAKVKSETHDPMVTVFPGASIKYDADRGAVQPTPVFICQSLRPAEGKASDMPLKLALDSARRDFLPRILSYKKEEEDDGIGFWMKVSCGGGLPVYWCILNFTPHGVLPTEGSPVQARVRQAWVQTGTKMYKLKSIFGMAGEDQGETECCICLEGPRNIMLMPCSHVCMCRECGKMTVLSLGKCPLCRVSVTAVVDMGLEEAQGEEPGQA